MAAGPRRRAGGVPERRAALPRHRLPALRGAALRPGVPDRGHPAAGGRARHHGLRHLHRLRLLRGGLPLSGPDHRPRPRVVLRGAEPSGGAGLRREPHRGRVQVHLLRGQDRRGGRFPGGRAGARPRGDPCLRRLVHRAGPALRGLRGPREQRLPPRARERPLPDARRARDGPPDPLPLRGARDHPGAGGGSVGRRGRERSERPPRRRATDLLGHSSGHELHHGRHEQRARGGRFPRLDARRGAGCGAPVVLRGGGGRNGRRAPLRLRRDWPPGAFPLRAEAAAELLDDPRDVRGGGLLPGGRRGLRLAVARAARARRRRGRRVPLLPGADPPRRPGDPDLAPPPRAVDARRDRALRGRRAPRARARRLPRRQRPHPGGRVDAGVRVRIRRRRARRACRDRARGGERPALPRLPARGGEGGNRSALAPRPRRGRGPDALARASPPARALRRDRPRGSRPASSRGGPSGRSARWLDRRRPRAGFSSPSS